MQKKLNLSQGLLRLWVVLSFLWMCFAIFSVATDIKNITQEVYPYMEANCRANGFLPDSKEFIDCVNEVSLNLYRQEVTKLIFTGLIALALPLPFLIIGRFLFYALEGGRSKIALITIIGSIKFFLWPYFWIADGFKVKPRKDQ